MNNLRLWFAIGVVLAGCSHGDGTYSGGSLPGIIVPPGDLVALDLANGTLAAATQYETKAGQIVFRKVPAESARVSTYDGVQEGTVPNVSQRDATVAEYYLAATEITQGQWRNLLAGSASRQPAKPWRDIVGSQLGQNAAEADDLPAFGLSRDMVAQVIADWNYTHVVHVRLPTLAEWERACRVPNAKTYTWGDGDDAATITQNAYVREAHDVATEGPAVVAKRNANSLNLFDLHGNVWEWVSGSPAMLKGGSWNDNLRSSQIDNHMKLDPAIPFALAGCRLVMEVRR